MTYFFTDIYESLFVKPKNYQISLFDRNDALYGKRVYKLEKKIFKECFVQDIGNFEVIKSVHKFFIDKNIIDVCAAPGGKSILLHSLGFNVSAIDKSQNQINKFKENLSRLNIKMNIKKIDFLKKKFDRKYNSIFDLEGLSSFKLLVDDLVEEIFDKNLNFESN